MKTANLIFDTDEMELRTVGAKWTLTHLLDQEGLFLFKDIALLTGINSTRIKKEVRALMAKGQSPWTVLGARVLFNRVIRMKKFAPYYRDYLQAKFCPINPTWTANDLMAQVGLFQLTEVCHYIPFSAHQIRHQIKKTTDSRAVMGAWKDEDLGCFVVDMAIFSTWVKDTWTNYGRPLSKETEE